MDGLKMSQSDQPARDECCTRGGTELVSIVPVQYEAIFRECVEVWGDLEDGVVIHMGQMLAMVTRAELRISQLFQPQSSINVKMMLGRAVAATAYTPMCRRSSTVRTIARYSRCLSCNSCYAVTLFRICQE